MSLGAIGGLVLLAIRRQSGTKAVRVKIGYKNLTHRNAGQAKINRLSWSVLPT